MKKAEKAVLGTWRITGMEVWDADYFDMEAPAHITIRSNLTGEFQFAWCKATSMPVSVWSMASRVWNSPGRAWMKTTR